MLVGGANPLNWHILSLNWHILSLNWHILSLNWHILSLDWHRLSLIWRASSLFGLVVDCACIAIFGLWLSSCFFTIFSFLSHVLSSEIWLETLLTEFSLSCMKNDQHREGHTAVLARSGKVTCPVAVTERLVKLFR